jgi:hypothetical protein
VPGNPATAPGRSGAGGWSGRGTVPETSWTDRWTDRWTDVSDRLRTGLRGQLVAYPRRSVGLHGVPCLHVGDQVKLPEAAMLGG